MCTIIAFEDSVRIWKLGAARFPLHQSPITDSLPPLSMAPAVVAVARRATMPARVWHRLPYTTKTRIGVCLDFFRFSPGCLSFFSVYVFQWICFGNFFSGGSKKAKLDEHFLVAEVPAKGKAGICSIFNRRTSPFLSKIRI